MSLDDQVAAIVLELVAPLAAEVKRLRAELSSIKHDTLPPNLLRPGEVQRRYGMSRATIRRHVQNGRLRATHVGGCVLIDVGSLAPTTADEIADLAAKARHG